MACAQLKSWLQPRLSRLKTLTREFNSLTEGYHGMQVLATRLCVTLHLVQDDNIPTHSKHSPSAQPLQAKQTVFGQRTASLGQVACRDV